MKNIALIFPGSAHQHQFLMVTIIFLMVTTMCTISTPASSQATKNLPPNAYKHVIKSNIPVEVKIIEGGKVKETHTTPIKEMKYAVGTKSVIPYEKRITLIDDTTFARLKLNPGVKGAREDFRILPELHIDDRGSVTEVFRIAFTLAQPFRYSYDQKNFNTTMNFFLVPETGNSTATLMEPLPLEVVSNIVNTITPKQLKIPHINLPSSEVALIAERVSDSAEVRVITASKPEGYPTFIKVEPSLEIFTHTASLQGFGIQTIPVEVRFVGSNSADSVKVNFNISKGTVDPGSMMLRYNQPATITVRSLGTGSVQLSAITSHSSSNVLPLKYTFPWPFLLASMIGGLIGGLIRHFFTAATKKFPLKPILGGMLIGFFVAVAYYFLGINLVGLPLNATMHEIAVLGLSALGAYFGIKGSQKPEEKK